MASRNQFSKLKQNILSIALLSIFFSAFILPTQASALEDPNPPTDLPTFIESIKDGEAASLRGIFVANKMAFPIIQQPMGNPGYVSSAEDVVTQFSMASEVGNLGLLAHNHLAGGDFSQINAGDAIILVYGDGHTLTFIVDQILHYQALSPTSPYSDFKDIENGDVLNVEQLFNKVYRGDYHLTLQTCIENEGDPSWGRLFIIAKVLETKPTSRLKMHAFSF